MEEFKILYDFGNVVYCKPIHNYFKLNMYFEKHSGDNNKAEENKGEKYERYFR